MITLRNVQREKNEAVTVLINKIRANRMQSAREITSYGRRNH